MQKRMLLNILCTTLALSMAGILSGCGNHSKMQSTDLMHEVTLSPIEVPKDKPSEASSSEVYSDYIGKEPVVISDFSVNLFQQCVDSKGNTLISPTSVLYALAMTANGAREDTLAQMETAFGMPVDALNSYLSTYITNLPVDERYKLHIANAVWFRDDERFTVEQDFLQKNADYYQAGIYQAPFNNSTLKEINQWVKENTDGMISNILDEIPDSAVMYLVNALAFDAQWQEIYHDYQIRDGIFTKEDGSTEECKQMYSSENAYLEDENVTGFLKYYNDQKYAFVALLPKEGISVMDYVSTLTGEHLYDILTNSKDVTVNASIPKFKTEYSIDMNDTLQTLGMTDAFDSIKADFSGIGNSTNGNLFISRVLHKTFISVDEKGTEAGAVTLVEVRDECAMIEPEEIKTVYLDRPFVYLLIDCENNLPLFMGTVMEVNN